MEAYKKMNDGSVMRCSDLAVIPPTEDNPDYLQYLTDVENGAVVTDFDYKAEAQRQVVESALATAAQEKEALIQAKMREIAEAELIAEGKLVAEK